MICADSTASGTSIQPTYSMPHVVRSLLNHQRQSSKVFPPITLQSRLARPGPHTSVLNPMNPLQLDSNTAIPLCQLRLRDLARRIRARCRAVSTEETVEQGTVHNSASASNCDADLDKRPDRGVCVGPGGIDEGEAMELGDAINGDYAYTIITHYQLA